jgi:hypothetical protein
MPGPHNAKKKKRGQKKKKNHTNSKTHTNTSPPTAHTTHDTVSDLSSLVTLLAVTTPGVHVVEDHSEGVPWHGHDDAPGFPGLPYGPTDDPTLILLSNPIIHDPGNGPRVKNMRAFLNSSFSQPACMDDPLCAEFAQREILQMLCTVLPEETALVRPFTLPIRCIDYLISDSHTPTFHLSRSACGTTRAGASGEFAPPVFVCTHF